MIGIGFPEKVRTSRHGGVSEHGRKCSAVSGRGRAPRMMHRIVMQCTVWLGVNGPWLTRSGNPDNLARIRYQIRFVAPCLVCNSASSALQQPTSCASDLMALAHVSRRVVARAIADVSEVLCVAFGLGRIGCAWGGGARLERRRGGEGACMQATMVGKMLGGWADGRMGRREDGKTGRGWE